MMAKPKGLSLMLILHYKYRATFWGESKVKELATSRVAEQKKARKILKQAGMLEFKFI